MALISHGVLIDNVLLEIRSPNLVLTLHHYRYMTRSLDSYHDNLLQLLQSLAHAGLLCYCDIPLARPAV